MIGTNFGSVPEIVDHGRTGFVCNNMEDLEVAIQQVGAIKPEECRRAAMSRFSRRVMARAYLAEYKAVTQGRHWGVASAA